jgi:uncharacterized protein YciI
MHYAIVAYDKPNALAKRMAARPEHLKHLETLGDRLLLAGPFLDENGDMAGSFMVIEAGSQEEAEAIYAKDPFMVQGVFDSITIKPWQLTINNTVK